MKPKLKILGLLAISLTFLWVACTNLIEWRGAGIPKIVLKKSGPNLDELRQERELDQRKASVETSNLTDANGTSAD